MYEDGSVPPKSHLHVGSVGRFRLVGRIARGGMAEIFLARPDDPDATDAGAEVALKRIHPGLRKDAELLDMFRDEASLASKLDHPNVVRILELGDDPGDPNDPAPEDAQVPFIVMEMLRGPNLRDLLTRLQALHRTMPVDLGMLVMLGALRALEHAHELRAADGQSLNLVHRDVSPQNVICTYDGAVKLVDFGVAKAEGRLHRTRAGMIKGKFAYMSPEQVDGLELDGRSDLFALAEVIYELLLRRHPFYAASDMDVLRKILDEAPPDPLELEPDFPPELGQLLMRALQKRPSERFASAAEMAAPIEAWLSSLPRRPTSGHLAGFIRDVFRDRLSEEEEARRAGDEEALIDAMQVGRASVVGMITAEPEPQVQPSPLSSEASDDLPTMVFTQPPDPSASPTPAAPVPEARREPPPSLGRSSQRPPRPGSVRVVPAEVRGEGPRIVASEHAGAVVDPAERGAARDPAADPWQEPSSPPIQPRTVGPRAQTRSTTLRSPESPGRFRLDLLVFVAGFVALVGAVIFALIPAGDARMIVVDSEPSGGRIVLDGRPTGLLTPSTVPFDGSAPMVVEVQKDGHLPCRQVVPAAPVKPPSELRCLLPRRPTADR